MRANWILGTAFMICSGCISSEGQLDLGHIIVPLEDRRSGRYELKGVENIVDFHNSIDNALASLVTASSPHDSLLYRIEISDSGFTTQVICKIDHYARYFAYFFEDCSSLHIDNESGDFTLFDNVVVTESWNYADYTPQVIPLQPMEYDKGWMYILNSSRIHDMNEPETAKAYYRDIKPVLRFKIDEPRSSVQNLGSFPSAYAKGTNSIGDYQPLFCVNSDYECVLSFRYADSLYFASESKDRAVACRSTFYTEPKFLTFDDAKSMRSVRKFESESSMYLWVKYNPIRDEYYRLCKHAHMHDGKPKYSILVLDAEMNQTAELIFDGETYMIQPLINTKDGFMLVNLKESVLIKGYCFESFDI